MEKVLKSILYILLILLVLFAGYLGFRALRILDPAKPSLTVVPGTLDWTGLPPIILPAYLATNPAASNAAWEVNQYRTEEPYIAANNGRIYAGLYNRDWSIEYKVSDPLRHEAGVIVGGGIYGAFYRFNPIGKLTVGGQLVWDGEKEIRAAGTVGWMW
jgi:hypothetical protein